MMGLLSFRLVLSLIGLFMLAGCGTLSKYQIDSGETEARRYAASGDLRQEVDNLATPLVRQGKTPGVVVGVLQANGESRFYSYGLAKKEGNEAIDENTVFPIGSLSKGFLGIMTTQLVKEGSLSWDDTLEALLPPTVKLSADARKITLQQLASHTSGLPRQPFDLATLHYFLEYLFDGKNFYRHYDSDFIYSYLGTFRRPDRIEPQYSNIGYGLLGHIIEIRTKKNSSPCWPRKLPGHSE